MPLAGSIIAISKQEAIKFSWNSGQNYFKLIIPLKNSWLVKAGIRLQQDNRVQ